MSQSINIVKLIEENPNTKLSKTYQGSLINKLKDSFSTDEQQLFISSFYCYLNYKSDDFVVDLDDVWSWLGFSTKQKSKDLLEKNFKVDIEFKKDFNLPVENYKGRPKEKIMLNIKTFKKMCLKANTSKANEIHEYYIKLEETLHEVIDEESNELRLQLQEKESIIEETKDELTKLTKKYVKPPKEVIDGNNFVYLITSEEKEVSGEFVIGKSLSLTNRKEDYNQEKLHNHKIIYYRSFKSSKIMDIAESLILSKFGKYRCKAGRDVFQLPESSNISLFTDLFDKCFDILEDIEEENVIFPKRTQTNEDKKKYNENRKEVIDGYSEEKKEELKEREIEYKIKNEEAFSELRKIDHEENREERIKKSSDYYEKNKEDMKKQANEYYSNNKSFILDESKKRYEENKDEIKEVRKEYYEKNYKDKIAAQRQKKEKCECGLIVTHYQMNKHKKTEKHTILMEIKNNNQTEILDADKKRCDCGMVISLHCLQKHIKSARHEMFMDLIEEMKNEKSDEEEDDEEDECSKNNGCDDDEICECGFILSSKFMRRHKKSKRHKLLMEKKLKDGGKLEENTTFTKTVDEESSTLTTVLA